MNRQNSTCPLIIARFPAARKTRIHYFEIELFFEQALLEAEYFKVSRIAFEQQLISFEFFRYSRLNARLF